MATLHKKAYTLPAITSGTPENWRAGYKAHDEAFKQLCDTHEMFSTGVADGMAWYIVKSRKPLVLQYVDYMDGYAAPLALIRGLRLADIDGSIRRQKGGFRF